jgi:hypothetical protein
MPIIPGTVGVTGVLAPKDDADTYPVIDPQYGIDGLRNVATYAERNAIPNLRRKRGMIVGVQSDDSWWQLKVGPWVGTNADWQTPTFASSNPLLTSDIVVSLSGGKTMGKYLNGQTIPAIGKTLEQVIRDIAIEDIAPTYSPATISLSNSVPTLAEVGTAFTTNLSAVFTQNDAGALNLSNSIRIKKNGVSMLPEGIASPFNKTDSDTFINGSISYQAFCDYQAGIIKNYLPSGTPDARTPLIRNINAPQAAESNFGSNIVSLVGSYKNFYGTTSTVPSNSVQVRALSNFAYVISGNVFTIATGITDLVYAFSIPSTKKYHRRNHKNKDRMHTLVHQ